MAKKDTFLMVSLEEDEAKKLAQVISNDTCRSILDYLAQKKATETELANDLNIPISTVHYNLKHLLDSKLVDAEEFHYSEKGKEVLHYSLANKYVIIAPKTVSDSFRNKLRSIIPAIAIIGVLALIIQYAQRFIDFGGAIMMKAAPATERLVATEAPAAQEAAVMAVQESSKTMAATVSTQPIGLWFAIGAILCLSIYLFVDYLIKKKRGA